MNFSFYRFFFKPLIDKVFAFILLVLTFPILLVLLILIRLESKGFPLYSQKRVGYKAKPFTIYKLRSMYSGSDKGSLSTAQNDSRITKVGYFIRKSSLDELPQLLNILLGQMSFIGPRPDVPSQESDYKKEDWNLRHSIKPGITGLAQSKLRSQATPSQRLNMDLHYVENLSFSLDLKILFSTFVILLQPKKSY